MGVSPICGSRLDLIFNLLTYFFYLGVITDIFAAVLATSRGPTLTSLVDADNRMLTFTYICMLAGAAGKDLDTLTISFSTVPYLFLLVISVVICRAGGCGVMTPSLHSIHFSLIQDIINLNKRFFIIVFSVLFVFRLAGVVLSEIRNPRTIARCGVTCGCFGMLGVTTGVVLAPF